MPSDVTVKIKSFLAFLEKLSINRKHSAGTLELTQPRKLKNFMTVLIQNQETKTENHESFN